MNRISFKISSEILMEMSALKSPEDGFQYIEDCFAIDKTRIEKYQLYSNLLWNLN